MHRDGLPTLMLKGVRRFKLILSSAQRLKGAISKEFERFQLQSSQEWSSYDKVFIDFRATRFPNTTSAEV